jgi:N-methylhydantoinase A
VVAAKYVGELVGLQNGIIFDMGGTTSKAALIHAGDISVTSEYCPAGYPIRIPVADMIELGIGGGSIGWIDEEGFPQVGPTSSGAAPGPVCYDLGGLEPTITDANVVLGRVRSLLGGNMELHKQKAEEAIITKLANPLHLDLLRAAEGIIEIAVAKIVDIMRAVSVSKGIDIRDFAMFAFGGAGPMHSAFIAKELGLNTIVVPPSPGTFSALGFLCSDLRHDFVKTAIMNTREISLERMEAIFNNLESQGVETLRKEGVEPKDIILMKSVDMRYVGQAHEINIPFHPGGALPSVAAEISRLFHQTYEQHYGHTSPGEVTEIINFRLTAVGRVKKTARVKKSEKKEKGAVKGRADVYFKETGWTDCSIYKRDDLGYGAGIDGPAIIEERTATTVIPPDMQADIDEYGNIILRWS